VESAVAIAKCMKYGFSGEEHEGHGLRRLRTFFEKKVLKTPKNFLAN
jgi:hypothetical protein